MKPTGISSCADNELVEGFFGMIKQERVNRGHYRTRADAGTDIFRLHRNVLQSEDARRTRAAAEGKIRLNETVRENGP